MVASGEGGTPDDAPGLRDPGSRIQMARHGSGSVSAGTAAPPLPSPQQQQAQQQQQQQPGAPGPCPQLGLKVESRVSIPLAMLRRDLSGLLQRMLPGGLTSAFSLPARVQYRCVWGGAGRGR